MKQLPNNKMHLSSLKILVSFLVSIFPCYKGMKVSVVTVTQSLLVPPMPVTDGTQNPQIICSLNSEVSLFVG